MIYLLFPHNNPFVLIHHRLFYGELNPMLKNIWLVIHPPSLYGGYSITILLTAIFIGSMVDNKLTDFKSILLLKFIAIIGLSLLSLGLIIGAIWAYYTLGWGGLWFWDSVENLALLPWLGFLGVIHSILFISHSEDSSNYIKKSSDSNKNLAMFWLIVSTSLILIGIILERSNLLISSHSFFTKEKIGIYSLIVSFIIILSIIWIIFLQLKSKIYLKNKILLVVNCIIFSSIIIVMLGIIYPIITSFYGHNISIGASFYNVIIVPLWIVGYLGLLFHLKNKKTSLIFFVIGITIAIFLRFSYNLSVKDTILSVGICATSLAVSSSLLVSLFKNLSIKKISITLIHISISMLMVGWLSISVYSQEKILNLEINKPKIVNGKLYTLKTVKHVSHTNKITGSKKKQIYSIINVMEKDRNKLKYVLKPSLLKENKGTGWQITNTNPDTILTILSNTYIALVNDVSSENKYYTFRIYQHYLFSLILMAFGLFFLGLLFYTISLITEIYKVNKNDN